MFISYRIAGTMLLALLCFSTGCPQQSVQQVGASGQETIRTQTVDDSHPRAKLILGSKDLVGSIVLINPRLRQVGQLTQAQVTIQNLTENRYNLEYEFEWYDKDGFHAGPDGIWQRFTLTPMITRTFTSMGKVPGAIKIVFTVRLPDDAVIELDKKAR